MTTTNRSRIRRRRLRTRSRGAAMLEGIIVLSTLFVFLGLIVWTRNSYAMKMDAQQDTRATSLYYAAHGCTGDKGSASSETTGSIMDSSPEAENAAKKSNLAGTAAVTSRRLNTAKAHAARFSSWQAIWDANGGKGSLDLKRHSLGRTIQSDSKVTCNEPDFGGGGWKDYFQWGVSLFKNGGLGGVFQ